MPEYQHILLAIDIHSELEPVIAKAQNLRGASCKLSMLYVVEPVPYPENYFGSVPLDVQQTVIDHCKVELSSLGKRNDIAQENQHLLIGSAAQKIHQFAEENSVDLIVMGSHGKHGLRLLLGSTANAVLHGASCDVLAVRVDSEK
jgi:universal stress protein A